MKRLILAGLVLAPAPLAAAPQDAAPAAEPGATDAKSEYQALEDEFGKAQQDFYKLLREKQDAGELTQEFMQENDPTASFVPRFYEAAEKHAGKDGAIPFLTWVVMNDNEYGPEGMKLGTRAYSAAEAIVQVHVTSAAVEDYAVAVGRMARGLGVELTRSLVDPLIEKNEHDAVLAEARFARASAVLYDSDATDDDRAMAVEDMHAVMVLAPESRTAQRAESSLFEIENLQIGMVAPDIVGNDLDGVEFKLSDYRGKVVLLDFWGDW